MAVVSLMRCFLGISLNSNNWLKKEDVNNLTLPTRVVVSNSCTMRIRLQVKVNPYDVKESHSEFLRACA